MRLQTQTDLRQLHWIYMDQISSNNYFVSHSQQFIYNHSLQHCETTLWNYTALSIFTKIQSLLKIQNLSTDVTLSASLFPKTVTEWWKSSIPLRCWDLYLPEARNWESRTEQAAFKFPSDYLWVVRIWHWLGSFQPTLIFPPTDSTFLLPHSLSVVSFTLHVIAL